MLVLKQASLKHHGGLGQSTSSSDFLPNIVPVSLLAAVGGTKPSSPQLDTGNLLSQIQH